MTAATNTSRTEGSGTRYRRLRWYNATMGLVHLVQGVMIVALTNNFALPVSASFMSGPPGSAAPELTRLFDIRIGWGVAAFVFMSAVAHWSLVLPGTFEWYSRNLGRNRNYARWIEYAFSSSVMVVLIAMLTGISDVAAVGAIFAVNAGMILFGLLMEHYESPGSPSWLPFGFGSLMGAVPWLLIGIYIWSPGDPAQPPAFVYGIFISLFIFFNSFAVNMVLQYRRIGPWKDYLFGESAYILLSLTAKSLLAWQVFAGALAS